MADENKDMNRDNRDKNREHDDKKKEQGGAGRQGFASMDPEKQREIASEGGKASHGGRGDEHGKKE